MKIKTLLLSLGIFLGIVSLILGIITAAFIRLRQDIPSPEEVLSYQPPIAAKVFDCKGRVIYQFSSQRREPVPLSKIPDYLKRAVVIVEDRRFYHHWGLDVLYLLRAFLVNITHGRVIQGGSTITQQLARNMFLTQEKSLLRKIKEALLAVELEHCYSKREILELYLNQVYFGSGAYGVEAAAQTFFSKHIWELSPSECALLAAVIKSPAYYSPYKHPEKCKRRRNFYLIKMAKAGIISEESLPSLLKSPLGILPKRPRRNEAPYFIDMVRNYLEAKYGSDFLYRSGISIYTTLDIDLQREANRVFEEHLRRIEEEHNLPVKKEDFDRIAKKDRTKLPNYLQGALIVMEPKTGYIRALIGGRDFSQSYFNRAIQAHRQAGSAFKVFVATAAIDNGLTPATITLDAPIVIDIPGAKTYEPMDYDRKFLGTMTLRKGLALSRNLVFVRLGRNLGPELVAKYAYKMGITTPLKPVYSLPLGSSEVSLLDMVRAYATLDNQGAKVEPIFITKIVDKEGRILEEHFPRIEQVISPQTAYVTLDMMRSVIDEGTASIIRRMGFLRPAAGKTGTTDEYTDAWFIGFTPELVCGVWVGFDKKSTIFRGATGGGVAAPIWAELMSYALKDSPPANFTPPEGVIVKEICTETGKLATPYCPHKRMEVFIKGTEPKEECQYHKFLREGRLITQF